MDRSPILYLISGRANLCSVVNDQLSAFSIFHRLAVLGSTTSVKNMSPQT